MQFGVNRRNCLRSRHVMDIDFKKSAEKDVGRLLRFNSKERVYAYLNGKMRDLFIS